MLLRYLLKLEEFTTEECYNKYKEALFGNENWLIKYTRCLVEIVRT